MRGALVVVLLVPVFTLGCRSGDSFDREGAIRQVLDAEQGAVNRQQAECYVDRMRSELGAAKVLPGATLTPAEIQRRTSIRIDCIGVTNLGTEPTTSTTVSPDDTEPGEPRAYGDDPTLDALYDRCRAGSGPACDELFAVAPLGSDYEQFAVTCGGRTRERACAIRYPDTSAAVTNP